MLGNKCNNARDLWQELCSIENLESAFKKARKGKTQKHYVKQFENNLKNNITLLRTELLLHCYSPKPLKEFILRSPKTRKISKSDFRDRVMHHALCNMIEPVLEKSFINDSYANRKGKGTLKAIKRFYYFIRKESHNNKRRCYILKADIKKYFDNVSHEILVNLIRKKIHDKRILWLIRKILSHYKDKKGMPLGNLTSQFFANVYLNQLDWYVKRELKVSYYIRYVDDFVIIDSDRATLEAYQEKIDEYLKRTLQLCLHPQKSKIYCLGTSFSFLGIRVFYYHKLLNRFNAKKMNEIYSSMKNKSNNNYNKIYDLLEGWFAYAMNANTYNLRKRIYNKHIQLFPGELSDKEINRFIRLCN